MNPGYFVQAVTREHRTHSGMTLPVPLSLKPMEVEPVKPNSTCCTNWSPWGSCCR